MSKKPSDKNFVLLNLVKARKARSPLQSLPPELRGPSNNKYGGHRGQRMRAFKGSTFGAATPGRSLNSEEKEKAISDLKKAGLI